MIQSFRTAWLLSLLLACAVHAADAPTPEPNAAAKAAACRQTFALLARHAPPSQRLMIVPARQIEATLRYRVEAPELEASEWIFFAPGAVELDRQTKVQAELTPGGLAGEDLSPLKHPLLWARMPVESGERKKGVDVIVRYRATLMAKQLAPLDSVVLADVSPAGDEAAATLARSDLLDWDRPAFQAWLTESALHPVKEETDLAFGRRVFLAIRKQCSYEFKPDMDRTSSIVCQSLRSDCGGLSALFSSVMRAHGIPARLLFGRWALSAKAEDRAGGMPYRQQHVKAEFYCNGIGWVPVDLASAILHDHTQEGLRYFGRDRGDFLVMHVEAGFEVDTIHFGRKSVGVLQSPVFWVTGKGTLDGYRVEQDWEVRTLDPPDRVPSEGAQDTR